MTLAVYPITSKPNTAEALPSTAVASDTYLDITTAPYQSTASVALTVNSSTGTFSQSSSSEMAKFGVTTNNYTGYNLSIIGSDDTKQLINNTTSTALDSITSSIDGSTFSNPANTSYNGKWGYKPSKYNSAANTSFHPAPTTSGSTLDNTISANTKKSTAMGDTVNCTNYDCNEYTIALGARADMGVKAGTYTNTFILTAVGNSVPYTLNFLDTSEDSSISNMPTTPISGETKDTSIAIPTNVPVRTGYSFAGWCNVIPTSILDDTTSTTNPVTSGSTVCKDSTGTTGTIYQPSTTTTTNYYDFIDQTMPTNISSLYALWNANTYTVTITNNNTTTSTNTLTVPFGGEATLTVTPASGYYLSSVSCPTGYTCSGYSTGTSATNTQTVTIRNNNTTSGGTLAFTGTLSCTPQSGTMQNFTPNTASGYCESGTLTDTRDNQTYTVAKINDGWWMTKNLNIAGGTTLTTADSNIAGGCNLGNNCTLPTSSTSGFSDNSTAYVYNSGSTTCSSSSPCYSYYSYVAATAGTNPSSGNAPSDICPKGWRLPTSAEYGTLYNSYNTGEKLIASPFLGVYAGGYHNSSFFNGGRSGLYWSSFSNSSTAAFNIAFSSGYAGYDYFKRGYGLSVRCVLETRTPYEKLQAGVLSMQGIGNLTSDEKSTLVSQMSTGTSYNVSDSRDGESYKIAKLADGKIWLQDNLRLGSTSTIALTPSDTNIASDWTLPAGITSGFNSYTAAQINIASKDTATTSYGSGSGKIGVYYNYCAASAGTYCYAQNSGTGNASYDICPKGWRMPTGGNSGEYKALHAAYSGDTTNLKTALSTPLSGDFLDNYAYSQGSRGYFWSSIYFSDGYMYSLNVYSSSVSTADRSGRNYGNSVRCVLKPTTISGTMQTVGSASLYDDNAIGTLTDSRDSQTYTVAKINDNLWMTQNLRFTGTSINSGTTNINTSKTLSYGDLTSGNTYTEPRIHDSGNTTNGVWYNYCAASAGTICTSSDSAEASYSLCPAGWRLPTNSEQSGITSYSSVFSPVTGGFYRNSSIDGTSNGYWWASTTYANTYRYFLAWYGSSLDATSYGNRYDGFYVRCVRSS